MVDKVFQRQYLQQGSAAYTISDKFGDQFTHLNESGNYSIGKAVLRKFNQLSKDSIVWSRSERGWRPRHALDLLGRSQD